PGGPLAYLKSGLPALDLNDLGSLYPALATALPQDRMGHTHFWRDLNYSSYSYERFFPEIENAPDQATKEALLHEKWAVDTERLKQTLAGLDNLAYYRPMFRDVNESYCTSISEFANSDIQELGLELGDFVNNVMNGSGAVMQASETDTVDDYSKPFNLLSWSLDQLL